MKIFKRKKTNADKLSEVKNMLKYVCDKDLLDTVVYIDIDRDNIVHIVTHKAGLWIGKGGSKVKEIHANMRVGVTFDFALDIIKSKMWE
jgi:ribosomal protein S3